MIKNVMLGSDPELFIYDNAKEKVISSIGIIPGEKGKAYRSEDMPEGFGLQIDNILGEFNVPPCADVETWISNMNYMKDYIRTFVQKVNPNYDIRCMASAHVDWDQLTSPEALLFGCSADFNAYTEHKNPAPEGDKTNLRSAGVHIHCSYDDPDIDLSLTLIKYFDMYLGIPSVVIDPDTERRSLYGKAGCFRLKDYGFEYRVLSGKFIDTDELIGFMFTQSMKAVDAMNNKLDMIDGNLVQEVINTSNVEKAKELINQFNLM